MPINYLAGITVTYEFDICNKLNIKFDLCY